jgi:hypothetical protein
VPAPHQLLGQRMGRDHMPPCPAGGENVVPPEHHLPLHFTT